MTWLVGFEVFKLSFAHSLLLCSEWIDFPRGEQQLPNGSVIPGNNYSYDKCRRRFDLVSS